jgi:hypothetical protein
LKGLSDSHPLRLKVLLRIYKIELKAKVLGAVMWVVMVVFCESTK